VSANNIVPGGERGRTAPLANLRSWLPEIGHGRHSKVRSRPALSFCRRNERRIEWGGASPRVAWMRFARFAICWTAFMALAAWAGMERVA
jgi:hypothetical protein